MISRHTILFFLCLPFPLYTMDSSNTSDSKLTVQQKRDLKTLYSTVYKYFTDLTPTNESRHNILLDMLAEINHRKQQGFSELAMQNFAFNQKETVSDRIRTELNNPPYNGPAYICSFFARIEAYNKTISSQNLTTPSSEQYCLYQDNGAYNDAQTTAQSFGLNIYSVIESKELIKTLPPTIAFTQFSQLLQDVCRLRTIDPSKILTIAGVLCLPAEKLNIITNT